MASVGIVGTDKDMHTFTRSCYIVSAGIVETDDDGYLALIDSDRESAGSEDEASEECEDEDVTMATLSRHWSFSAAAAPADVTADRSAAAAAAASAAGSSALGSAAGGPLATREGQRGGSRRGRPSAAECAARVLDFAKDVLLVASTVSAHVCVCVCVWYWWWCGDRGGGDDFGLCLYPCLYLPPPCTHNSRKSHPAYSALPPPCATQVLMPHNNQPVQVRIGM